MLIIGAKGFAKEVLEICLERFDKNSIHFYDDVNIEEPCKMFDHFPIIKDLESAQEYFSTVTPFFALGIGKPKLRERMSIKFRSIGGVLKSTISKKSNIGSFDVIIGEGTNILGGAQISNDVQIGTGSIIYYNAVITHDCRIGDYVEISPGAKILGRVKIGNIVSLGANSTILPDITIGDNVIVGAGAVVTRNIPNNCVVAGVPAKIIKQI